MSSTHEGTTPSHGLADIFQQQREAEDLRYRNLVAAQIRNAIIEIEEGDTDGAIDRLKALIGEYDPDATTSAEG